LSIGEMKAPPRNAGYPEGASVTLPVEWGGSLREASLLDRRDSRSNLRHSDDRLSLHVASVEPDRLLATQL